MARPIVDPSQRQTVGGAQFFLAIFPLEHDRRRRIARLLTSLCGSQFDSSALGLYVIEDECGDEESKKDSNDTIADVIRDR